MARRNETGQREQMGHCRSVVMALR
jgi:hypothetical protein